MEDILYFVNYKTCLKQCRVPSYTCSGPPKYNCETKLVPLSLDQSSPTVVWQDYDTCLKDCISPQLQLLYPPPQPIAVKKFSPAPPLQKVNISQWIWIITVLSFSLAVIIVFIYEIAKSHSKNNKPYS